MHINWSEVILIILSAVAGIQLIYFIFFYSRLAFYKKPKRSSSRQHAVSVVVCARDEAQNLADHLPLVLQQQYASTYEVVAVDDNSFDDSKYVLEHLSKIFKNLRVISLKQEARLIQGKKFPLSMGIKEAKHELLLLTDADCKPNSPDWILHIQDAFLKNEIEIVLGYSPYEKEKGVLNKLIRFETFFTALQYLSFALAGVPYMGVGRNLAYKRELFFRNKGFSAHNQIMGGDDDLFVNRIANGKNTTIVVDPASFTYSKAKKSWSAWRKQKARHYSTSRHYKSKHLFLLGLGSFSHFAFYPALIASFFFMPIWIPLSFYGGRLLIVGSIYYPAMKKLREKDLFWIYPILDIWQWFYYFLFSGMLLRAPKNSWK
ncbi:MAG: glycosyltransferase [Bacteroidota bacterium]|jgi:cellulose synthase/poly-beta-1,6-N-acetylglucosamine synthase-like glycosyltransferase